MITTRSSIEIPNTYRNRDTPIINFNQSQLTPPPPRASSYPFHRKHPRHAQNKRAQPPRKTPESLIIASKPHSAFLPCPAYSKLCPKKKNPHSQHSRATSPPCKFVSRYRSAASDKRGLACLETQRPCSPGSAQWVKEPGSLALYAQRGPGGKISKRIVGGGATVERRRETAEYKARKARVARVSGVPPVVCSGVNYRYDALKGECICGRIGAPRLSRVFSRVIGIVVSDSG